MKIDPSKSRKIGLPFNKKNSLPSDTNIEKSADFKNLINDSITNYVFNDFNKELEQTIFELDSIVNEFKKNPASEEVLFKYKNRLARFLSTAMNMFQEKQIDVTGSKRSKASRIVTTIKIIDENLVDITEGILQNEKKRIALLAKFDMLKGLLLNLKIG